MSVEKTIGGHLYRFEKLGYRRARAVLVRTAKVLSPVLAGMAGMDIKGLASADIGKLAPAISAGLESLTDDDLEFATQAFGDHCSVRLGDGWAPLADEAKRAVFFDRAGLGSYFAWLRAGFEVTYGDFFAELRAIAKSKPGDEGQVR